MEPAHLLVHATSAVADGRDENLTLQQMTSAEAALAVAAVGVDGDARALEADGYGLRGLGVDDVLVDAAQHRDLEGLLLRALGIAGQGRDIRGVVDHVVPEAPGTDTELVQRRLHKAEHRQRPAEHVRAALGGITADDLLRDEALFAGPVGLVRQHVHDLYIRAGLFNGVQLVLQHDVVCLDRAVQNRQLHALQLAIGDLLRHRVEGGDAASARKRHNIPAVAHRLVIEEAEGKCALKLVPDLYVLKQPVRHEVRHVAPDRDLKEAFVASRLIGGRGNGVGP